MSVGDGSLWCCLFCLLSSRKVKYLYLGRGRPRGVVFRIRDRVRIGSTAVLMILSKNAGAWNGWWDERSRVNVKRVGINKLEGMDRSVDRGFLKECKCHE